MCFIQQLALGNLDRFSNEWYKKNPKHLSLRGENRLRAGAALRSFPPLSFSNYSQVNAEHKTFKIANIHHLQLQGQQNTTTEESLRLL